MKLLVEFSKINLLETKRGYNRFCSNDEAFENLAENASQGSFENEAYDALTINYIINRHFN